MYKSWLVYGSQNCGNQAWVNPETKLKLLCACSCCVLEALWEVAEIHCGGSQKGHSFIASLTLKSDLVPGCWQERLVSCLTHLLPPMCSPAGQWKGRLGCCFWPECSRVLVGSRGREEGELAGQPAHPPQLGRASCPPLQSPWDSAVRDGKAETPGGVPLRGSDVMCTHCGDQQGYLGIAAGEDEYAMIGSMVG